MRAGYVARAVELKAAVHEAERINRPLICWPEDIGRITPDDLPQIDLQVAMGEFILIEREWRYSNEPLTLPTPGKAYAVITQREMDDDTLMMEVAVFRPKTAVECHSKADRVENLRKLSMTQWALINVLAEIIDIMASTFIHPDVPIHAYPELDELLEAGDVLRLKLEVRYLKVEEDERIAGKVA